jgi:hypothetical protein
MGAFHQSNCKLKKCIRCGDWFRGTEKKIYCDYCLDLMRVERMREGTYEKKPKNVFKVHYCPFCKNEIPKKKYDSIPVYNKKKTCGEMACRLAYRKLKREANEK